MRYAKSRRLGDTDAPNPPFGGIRRYAHRDFLAGALLLITGAAAMYTARGYGVGSVRDMGPGFFPVSIGAVLAIIGVILLAATWATQMLAGRRAATESTNAAAVRAPAPVAAKPEWRGWFCIVASLVVFILVANYGGLVPATFFSVLLAALGDRKNSLRNATLLALGITVLGVLVFYWGLSIQLPLFAWGGR